MKILIMEDPCVLPIIRHLLEEIDLVHGGCFEFIVCSNGPEAEIFLEEANMAIIDMDYGGYQVALKAIERYRMPIIATSALLGEGAFKDTRSFCYMAKPMGMRLDRFRSTILRFQKIIEDEVRAIWRTEHFREELKAGSANCILN
jgi:hypothetical protein